MTAPAAPASAPTPDDATRQRDAVAQALASAPAHSRGTLQVGEQTLRYRVDAGFVPAYGTSLTQPGQPEAAIFTTAYQLEGEVPASRPVCFAFNGGPGASSVFLHIGVMGPKRIVIQDDGQMPPPPYVVQDNPMSWLPQFDMVFVDPPHTGYSLSASEEARKKHFSVDGDVAVLVEVVREWLTRHKRWGSPVFLCGESYGTTRCSAMAESLCEAGISLAGLILISSAMDLQALVFNARNDLPHALFLPAFAGAAAFHGTLKPEIAATPEAARAAALEFVHRDYLSALHRGNGLQGRDRTRIARRLGELTGLAPALVERHNLRISDGTFFVEALRSRGLVVGRMDARVTGPMGLAQPTAMEYDPGLEPLWGTYAMAAHQYFAETLGFAPERRYHVFGAEAYKPWQWNRGESKGNQYASTSPELARALRRMPHLRVLVASGVYDLATPVSATDWMLDQLELTPEVMARVQHRRYEGGHMMYSRQSELAQLHQDVIDWLAEVPMRKDPSAL